MHAAHPATVSTTLGRTRLAQILVLTAVGLSTWVFSEPALADAIMMGAIIGLPILRVCRPGVTGLSQMLMWIAITAFGILATLFSPEPDESLKHTLVTLFLAAGALIIAGYVTTEPEERIHQIMLALIAGCLVATICGLAGYFKLLPGAFDLFTSYGRARGTFKDPNVYGAAIIPAIAYLGWMVLRQPRLPTWLTGALALVLCLGLLVSFSRGAWISAFVAIVVIVVLGALSARRTADRSRLLTVGSLAVLTLAVAIAGALNVESVRGLLTERASLTQSYDEGPEGRFGGQQKAVALILDSPAGTGAQVFAPYHHLEAPHQVYLSMFLNAGWGGGLLYILSMLSTLVIGLRQSLRYGPTQGHAIVLTAVFAGIVVEGFVIDTDHWRHVFLVMGLIWGIADAERRRTACNRRRTDATPN